MRGAHMFLRKMTNKKTGRTYLSIVHSYRDKKTKKTRSKTIESLGYLDELEKNENPIAHFQAKIQEMNKEMNKEMEEMKTPITFSIDKEERIESNTNNRKNLGYAALSKIYHDLEIHTFFEK